MGGRAYLNGRRLAECFYVRRALTDGPFLRGLHRQLDTTLAAHEVRAR
jgi:hypothetical protein